MFLVDTDVLSQTSRPIPDRGACAWLDRQPVLAASVVTLEEIEFGILSAPPSRQAVLRRWFEELRTSRGLELLPIDEAVAVAAAGIWWGRRRAGQPISKGDLYIAATARTTGRTLVTHNVRHFDGLGLPLLDPFGP